MAAAFLLVIFYLQKQSILGDEEVSGRTIDSIDIEIKLETPPDHRAVVGLFPWYTGNLRRCHPYRCCERPLSCCEGNTCCSKYAVVPTTFCFTA